MLGNKASDYIDETTQERWFSAYVGMCVRAPDQPAGAIALSWVLRNPAISSAFFGTTRMSHLLDNLGSSGRIMSDDLLRKIADAQSSFS